MQDSLSQPVLVASAAESHKHFPRHGPGLTQHEQRKKNAGAKPASSVCGDRMRYWPISRSGLPAISLLSICSSDTPFVSGISQNVKPMNTTLSAA